MKKFIGIVLLLILFDSPAAASEKYFGLGSGQSKINVEDDPDLRAKDNNEPGFKFFAGVHVGPNLSIEGGYIDFGKFKQRYLSYDPFIGFIDETNTSEIQAFFISFLPTLPLSERAAVYGKIGFNYWDAEVNIGSKALDFSISGDDSDFSVHYGLGFEFKTDDKVSLRFEWETYKDVGDSLIINSSVYGPVSSDGTDVDWFGMAVNVAF